MRYRPDDWGSDEYKKRLNGELKKYKEVMASGLYDCLKAMLELEISALGPKISNKQRENLTKANMSLYRQISIYNIFCRIQKLFEEDLDKLEVYKTNWSQCLEIYIPTERINEDDWDEEHNLKLFEFDFKPQEGRIDIETFRNTHGMVAEKTPSLIIGDIDLHEYSVREGQNEKMVLAYQRAMKKTSGKRYGTFVGDAPERDEHGGCYGQCNDDMAMFEYRRSERIKRLQNLINYYENKKGLTDEEKLAIELSQKYHGLLLQELGFKEEDGELTKQYADQHRFVLSKPNYHIHNTKHFVE